MTVLLSAAATPAPAGFLSAVLGDHMVLQRAPDRAVVWGRTTGGATVSPTLNGTTNHNSGG